MMKRRSPFTGEMVEMPDPKPAGPDAAAQLADLRVLLATEQARREAAEARCADLDARLTEADQRAERIADDLERAHARIAAMADIKPITLPQPPEPAEPVSYQIKVTKRDPDGKIENASLVPIQ